MKDIKIIIIACVFTVCCCQTVFADPSSTSNRGPGKGNGWDVSREARKHGQRKREEAHERRDQRDYERDRDHEERMREKEWDREEQLRAKERDREEGMREQEQKREERLRYDGQGRYEAESERERELEREERNGQPREERDRYGFRVSGQSERGEFMRNEQIMPDETSLIDSTGRQGARQSEDAVLEESRALEEIEREERRDWKEMRKERGEFKRVSR